MNPPRTKGPESLYSPQHKKKNSKTQHQTSLLEFNSRQTEHKSKDNNNNNNARLSTVSRPARLHRRRWLQCAPECGCDGLSSPGNGPTAGLRPNDGPGHAGSGHGLPAFAHGRRRAHDAAPGRYGHGRAGPAGVQRRGPLRLRPAVRTDPRRGRRRAGGLHGAEQHRPRPAERLRRRQRAEGPAEGVRLSRQRANGRRAHWRPGLGPGQWQDAHHQGLHQHDGTVQDELDGPVLCGQDHGQWRQPHGRPVPRTGTDGDGLQPDADRWHEPYDWRGRRPRRNDEQPSGRRSRLARRKARKEGQEG